jgi:hypothetical protein
MLLHHVEREGPLATTTLEFFQVLRYRHYGLLIMWHGLLMGWGYTKTSHHWIHLLLMIVKVEVIRHPTHVELTIIAIISIIAMLTLYHHSIIACSIRATRVVETAVIHSTNVWIALHTHHSHTLTIHSSHAISTVADV